MSVGLDIGSKTIKIVELGREKEKFRLISSGIIGYKGKPPEEVKEDKDLVLLAESIKKLHKEAKISSKDVVLSLPETQVYSRIVKFPLLTDSEIASAVKWEAEQYIPIPLDDAIIRHQIIERREDKTPPEALVLLMAVPKDLVESYVKVCHDAGLSPIALETDLIALSRSLAPDDTTCVLVDFGSKATNIAITKDKTLRFSRSISTDGDAFTRAVSQYLGIELRQAEEYKKAYGMSSQRLEGRIKKALDPVLHLISDEIRKAMHFYQTDEGGESPTSVILSGGTSGMPNLVSVMTSILGLEVIVGNPFYNVLIDSEILSSTKNYAPFYSVAVGLAMREN